MMEELCMEPAVEGARKLLKSRVDLKEVVAAVSPAAFSAYVCNTSATVIVVCTAKRSAPAVTSYSGVTLREPHIAMVAVYCVQGMAENVVYCVQGIAENVVYCVQGMAENMVKASDFEPPNRLVRVSKRQENLSAVERLQAMLMRRVAH
ncbi:hypothetical protein FVE85_3855 [Porphyridium purpureum]|uniref:Uncharacterized protein n=1 Tax=Porphyridium purpureum TaxID=35688 RepID=A0A5J4YGS0_PORPP|nr:hypothetical protein FVE85_3855 [Porphyridium purpureum]|eukprot:POR6463..scf258_39